MTRTSPLNLFEKWVVAPLEQYHHYEHHVFPASRTTTSRGARLPLAAGVPVPTNRSYVGFMLRKILAECGPPASGRCVPPEARRRRPARSAISAGRTAAVPVLEARDYEYGVPGISASPLRGLRSLLPGAAAFGGRDSRASIRRPTPSTATIACLAGCSPHTFWLDARRIRRLIGPHRPHPRRRMRSWHRVAGHVAVRRKWDIRGLELDVAAARRAARARGLDVLQGDLEDLRLRARILRSRPPWPRHRALSRAARCPAPRCTRCSSPGGVLFGETPNVDCWDFRLFGRYWGALHVPLKHHALWPPQSRPRPDRQRLRGRPHHAAAPDGGLERGASRFFSPTRPACGCRPNGRVWWYAALIAPFLPVTALQALVSRPATLAFVARKPAR